VARVPFLKNVLGRGVKPTSLADRLRAKYPTAVPIRELVIGFDEATVSLNLVFEDYGVVVGDYNIEKLDPWVQVAPTKPIVYLFSDKGHLKRWNAVRGELQNRRDDLTKKWRDEQATARREIPELQEKYDRLFAATAKYEDSDSDERPLAYTKALGDLENWGGRLQAYRETLKTKCPELPRHAYTPLVFETPFILRISELAHIVQRRRREILEEYGGLPKATTVNYDEHIQLTLRWNREG
jgi:hypothetical protein